MLNGSADLSNLLGNGDTRSLDDLGEVGDGGVKGVAVWLDLRGELFCGGLELLDLLLEVLGDFLDLGRGLLAEADALLLGGREGGGEVGAEALDGLKGALTNEK